MEGIWKDIEGYNGDYQISNLGRVKSFKCNKEKILSPYKNKSGYYTIGLKTGKETKYFRVHRLVAKAFIPNPNNYPFINHKDETRDNNAVANLEWCTAKYNSNYGHSAQKISISNGKTVCQYDLKGNLINKFHSAREAGKALNVRYQRITARCRGEIKKPGKLLIWKYEDD